MIVWPLAAYFRTSRNRPMSGATSIGSAATIPTSAGTGGGAAGSWPRLGLPLLMAGRSFREVTTQENCHLIILRVSPSFVFIPTAAVVSNPTCIMQCSHRGSLPTPYFSQGVLFKRSSKLP